MPSENGSEFQSAEFPFALISITEGAARLDIPDMSQYRVPTDAPVFYNFLMEMNRDIAILAIKTYQELQERPISILLPLAATGVRGIRLKLETLHIDRLLMNDVSPIAYALMAHNLRLNNLSNDIELHNTDAIPLLNRFAQRGMRFDVIDIDPFGSPTRFIDSAIRALKVKSGMICLTATDMSPLCGVTPKACFRKYGGRPLRTEYCHEVAVRLCFHALVTTAAKYDITIAPLLSYSIDHYVRIYARLQKGALKTDRALEQLGYIVHCFECDYRNITSNLLTHSPICPACKTPLEFAGPLWLGPLFDRPFCQRLVTHNEQLQLGTKKRIGSLLDLILGEIDGPPTYHNIHRLCKYYHLSAVPTASLLTELQARKYFATRTHFSRVAIRTDAPRATILQIIQTLQP